VREANEIEAHGSVNGEAPHAHVIDATSIQRDEKAANTSTKRDSTVREWREREDVIDAIERISRNRLGCLEEMSMGKMLAIGTVGTLVALGALSSAAQAANPNVPSYSPYALLDVGGVATPEPAMAEHRAAFTAPVTGGVANTNVPSYSPYAIMPQAQ
jgi:hypothetical protein